VRCVGIRNSPEKARLLARGRSRAARLADGDLAYDCIRHLDFLERGGRDPRATLYWRYLVFTGRTAEAADARCRRFAELAEKIRTDGFDPARDPIAVTDDGMRLNGSHRAAIARSMGLGEVEVRVYSWDGALPSWRVRHVAEEARVKRDAQEQYLGREAADAATGEPLGRVAFVDAEVPGRVAAAFGRKARPALFLEREDGSLERRPAQEVTLR
jgi:hypothetical protein